MLRPRDNPNNAARTTRPSARCAFTLIEALVASALLGIITIAVISAVSASQTLAFEAEKQTLGALAADDMVSELVILPYDQLRLRDGLQQQVGGLQALDGTPYPNEYWALGRRVEITDHTLTHEEIGASIDGARVVVTAFDSARDLATIETFVPEPAP